LMVEREFERLAVAPPGLKKMQENHGFDASSSGSFHSPLATRYRPSGPQYQHFVLGPPRTSSWAEVGIQAAVTSSAAPACRSASGCRRVFGRCHLRPSPLPRGRADPRGVCLALPSTV